jgi:hypothetical protein
MIYFSCFSRFLHLQSFRYLLPLAITLTGCKKEVPPVDPCRDARPFSADFRILEHVGDSLVETNRVLHYNIVTLEAKGDYDTYEWQIRDEAVPRTGKRVVLRFLEDAIGIIDIALRATQQPSVCLPEDDGIDRVVKTLTVLDWGQAPIIGRYRGYFGSDAARRDAQVVEIAYESEAVTPGSPPSPFGSFIFVNINKGCNPEGENLTMVSDRGATALWYEGFSGKGCLNPQAWFSLQGADTLRVSFTQRENLNTNNRRADTFTGVRIR